MKLEHFAGVVFLAVLLANVTCAWVSWDKPSLVTTEHHHPPVAATPARLAATRCESLCSDSHTELVEITFHVASDGTRSFDCVCLPSDSPDPE